MKRNILSKRNSLIPIFAGLGGGIIIILIIILVLTGKISFNIFHLFYPQNRRDTQSLAKVGEETIYNQELNAEYAYYPLPRNPNTTKKFLLKIAKDSIILQGGAADGLIKLDNSFFNYKQVDYLKRMQMVQKVKNTLAARENKISGSVVAIFFYDNSPSLIGYEKGKEIAYSEISQLHDAVINKKMTMQQAGDAIKNDTNLAQVDKHYKVNAYYTFTVTSQHPITFNKDFDSVIKKTQTGKTTQILTGKDKDYTTHNLIDAVYMFAQVNNMKINGSNNTFDQWYAQKQKLYETTLY